MLITPRALRVNGAFKEVVEEKNIILKGHVT